MSTCQVIVACSSKQLPHQAFTTLGRSVYRGRRREALSNAAATYTDSQSQIATASADDLMREADILLQGLADGQVSSLPQSQAAQQAPEPPPGFEVRCDVNGCSIVKVASDYSSQGPVGPSIATSQAKSEPQDFELAEGKGWKLGYDKAPSSLEDYSALIGGDSWTIELSQKEYADFIRLLHNLRRSVATLQICGEWARGPNESDEATLELSTEHVWMQGRAPQKRLSILQQFDEHKWRVYRVNTYQELWNRGINNSKPPEAAFALRFIILTNGRREVEGHWSAEAVMDVLQHLEARKQDSPLRSTRDAFAKQASYA